MNQKRIGFLVFSGIQALDLVGPMDAFAEAVTVDHRGHAKHCYELVTIGLSSSAVQAGSGVLLKPQKTLQSTPPLDTLIIPGGAGIREPQVNGRISAWLKVHASTIRRIATVCTGIYGLAPTGLLDGRRVTTHWRFAQDVVRRFPSLQVDAGVLFVKDGKFYTAAGITAGIDLSLALIEEDHGRRVALSVARELVVYMQRAGGQAQYSEPLQFQTTASNRFADLACWIAVHLQEDLSVEVLAQRVHLSPRQFSRRFKSALGSTPAVFIEMARLEEARRRLSPARCTIRSVATSVGFHSDDVFRRTFERRFGITPTEYRQRFGT